MACKDRPGLNDYRLWHFEICWQREALAGRCDELHGAEFRRVWALWEGSNYAGDVFAYIRFHANTPSEGR